MGMHNVDGEWRRALAVFFFKKSLLVAMLISFKGKFNRQECNFFFNYRKNLVTLHSD